MAINWEKYRNKAKKLDENDYKQNISKKDLGPVKSTVKLTDDIGPVKSTVSTTENDRKWFQKSALFDDGYDFGDIFKTIIGSGTDVAENAAAEGIGVGEKFVDALAWVGSALSGQQMQTAAQNEMIFNTVTGKNIDAKTVLENYDTFQNEVEKGTSDFIKQDLYDEQAIAKKIITENVKEATGIDAETDSVFGEKFDELAQSAGQLGANLLVNTIAPGSGLVMTGVTTFGSEMESALNQGATYDEAAFSSAVSAGAEILTEKLTGGIKFGGKALDDALTSKITSRISNGVVRKIVDLGMDAAGEGFEEVLSGAMSAAGQKLSYMSDKKFTELFSVQDAWDSFVSGAALGGFFSAGKNVKAKIKGVDSVTGLTKNEQAVFDKVYNDRVNESKKGGKKLSGKDKENIYNSVMNDIEKGYIGISDIESVLGGETYKQYQSAVEKDNQMKELQKEYDSLYKMKNGEKSDEQIDRQKALKEQLDEYKNTSKLSDIQKQLSNEVSELAKGSRLVESYNEKSRRSQTFEADLTQYDEKHQGTYKRAMESGVLNNTNRTHEFVDLLAKLEADKGVLFDFTNNEKIKATGFAIEGKQVNGYVQGNNIAINIDSTSALNKVVGHEITHVLEGTELYNELANAVKEFATAKGEYDSKLQSIAEVYEGMENVNLENELTADLIGEYLFTDSDFINRLSAEKPTLFQKIFDEIKYLCKVTTAGSKEAKQLEKLKKTFEEAYRQKNNTATDDGVRYSVAGVKSKTHNFSALEQAIRLEDVGKATSEEIRQQTGWYRGYDGKWRYEIDDSNCELIENPNLEKHEDEFVGTYFTGKVSDVLNHRDLFEAYPQLKDIKIVIQPTDVGLRGRYEGGSDKYIILNIELFKRHTKEYDDIIKNGTTEIKNIEQTPEYKEYNKWYEDEKLLNIDPEEWLVEEEKASEKFFSSELGKRYYYLKWGRKDIQTHEFGWSKSAKEVLMHELQHAVQEIEGFTGGSSAEYWQAKLNSGFTIKSAKQKEDLKNAEKEYRAIIKKDPYFFSAMEELVKSKPDLPRGKVNWDTFEQIEEDPIEWQRFDANREMLEEEYGSEAVMNFFRISDKLKKLRESSYTAEQAYFKTAGEVEARDTTRRLNFNAEQRKNTRPDIDRTDVVFADDSGVLRMSAKDAKYDSETASISEQIKNSQSILNQMKEVGEATVPQNIKTKYEAAQWAISQLKTFGYQVDRQNFGKIYFDESDIRKGAEYADTNAEKGAFVLIPKVLKRGIEIGHHGNHKLRQKETITFAAPVVLNGVRGNMAVVVNLNGNRYLVHRIILPDGTTFKFFEKNKEAKQESYQGVTENSSLADTTSFTSTNSISAPNKNVKKNSLSVANDIDPVRERNNVYGEDIKLQVDGPVREDIAPGEATSENSIINGDEPIKATQSADVTEENNVEDTIDAEAVTRLSSKVISTLGIGKSKANRNAVRELVKVLGDNYSISSKEDLYNAVAEKFGTQYVEELNEEIAGARSYLKEVKIDVPDSVKSEFGSAKDYSSFVKSNFGKLWISKEGSGIDQIYAELNEMYPHLFPSDISNQADQLKQISDVVNKPKSDFVPFELDEDVLQETTDLIYDSVTEYRDAVSKVNAVTDSIEAADVSDKVKKQIKDELLTAYEKIEAEFNIDKKNLVNELNERKSNLETDTVDKNTFLKNHANALYNELKKLKKGVRASEDLAYFLDLGFNWNELKSTFLKVGKWPDTVLNSESEIETAVRDFLDQRYDDTVQELNDFDWLVEDELSNLESKAEEKRYNAKLAVNGKLVREIMDAEQVAMMGDTSLWKDKSKGFMYKTETEHRNFRDIVRDKNGKRNFKVADALFDYFMGTYNHNEAELKREANKIKKEYADLKLNKYEDVFVQMKGEFLHNPDSELTQHDIDTFIKLYGDKIDETKVDKTIDMARETYDSLIERMNEVLVAHGMKPIEYRKGYFPHFSEVEKGKLAQLAEKFLNWKTQNNDIPTDIAGMTESFKPNRSWQSFNKQRINDKTDYSFMKGFDSYLQGSLDWIYHIDDIMKRRVFENRIRYDHSDNGIKEQIQEIYKNNEFDTNAKQEQIDLVFREAENPLNNFIIDFRTRTNTLAGKKSSMDRGMEEFTSRKFYSTMTNISNRVTANMVVGSISSALTNFIPITQSWGEVSLKSSLRAMKDTIKSTFKDDGTIDKSDFLTNRFKDVENLYQTTWDKVIDKAGFMMEAIDNFTSQTVWRSKYLENMSKGMSEAEAIKNADEFAEGLIAGRSRGNMPTIFDSKNPLIKMATAFQLEVNNQYRYMFKDMPQDMKNESVAKLAKGYATMFIGANVYNALYSSLTGRDAAFDPIGIIQELLSDLFDDEEDEPADIIMNLTDNLLEEVPFVGGLLGGGRVPISSALPYDDGILGAFEGTITDLTEGDLKNLTKEWLSSAGAYLLLPAGGGQIKKTAQGLSMFLDDDLPIAGSYTDSGKLRFTVEETMDEMIKAGFFGQYASKTARQYFDENRSPLNDKKTQELIDLDVPIEKYWEYQDGLKALGEHATLNEKGDYIANLEGFTVEQKNLLINNIADRDEPIDLTGYENYSDFQEFDFATRYPEKYAVLQECGISVSEYKEKYEEKAIIYTDDFSWASNNADKYTLSKAVTNDLTEYKKYTSDLSSIKSDKDKSGNSISGSAKRKKVAYINSLDIEKGAKLILFKSQYKSDDTYNYEIVEYLNDRDDISRKEMETILTELGFTVHADGRVTW